MKLILLPDAYAIARLTQAPAAPEATSDLHALTITRDEISLVCAESVLPPEYLHADPPQRGYRALRIAGTLAFNETGILARLSTVLADARIPIFAVSTYRTDYLLLPGDRLAEARTALESDGHALSSSD